MENNVTNNGKTAPNRRVGISVAREARGNYVAGNSSATTVDSATYGTLDGRIDDVNNVQFYYVDAVTLPRSSPRTDVGPAALPANY